MFEQKKKDAQKTIQKKQQKVDEIERIMVEEITPVLDQLRSEKQSFYKYNANKSEIEALQKVFDAMQYWNNQRKQQALIRETEENQQTLSNLQSESDSAAMQLEIKQRSAAELNAQREKEFVKNEAYLALETKGNAFSKALVQADAQWKNDQANLTEELKEVRKVEKSLESSAKTRDAKKKEHSQAEEKLAAAAAEHKRVVEDIAHIKSAQLGISVGGAEGQEPGQGGLAGQLMGLQKELAHEEGAAKSASTKLKHAIATLKDSEKKLAASEKSGDGAVKALEQKKELIAKLEGTLSKAGVDVGVRAKVERKVSNLKDEVAALQSEADILSAKLGSRLKFDWNARACGLDAKNVKGLVASLVRVPNVQHTTALEITAGAKLYNVVVDTEESGKTLLEKGQLKKRVTIIPLNKIQARQISPAVVAKAEQLGGAAGNVKLALSVVGYDAQLQAAMSYIFGSSFVVADSALAQKITFHPEVRTKCVTLDGDVYDPSGTLEGGALPSGPSVLTQLMKLNEVQESLTSKSSELGQMTAELKQMAAAERETGELQKKLDILRIEFASLQERQSQSEHFAVVQSVEAGRKDVDVLTATINGSDSRKKDLRTRIDSLEKMIKDFEGERAKSTQQMESRLISLQKDLTAASKKLSEQQKKVSMLAIELAELESEHATLEASLAKLKKDCAAAEATIAASEKAVEAKRAEFDAFDASLRREKEKFASMDKSISKVQKEIAALQKSQADAVLESKKVSNALIRLQGERAELIKAQQRMEKELEWLKAEKHLFGQAGSEYDFTKTGAESTARLAALQAEQEQLSKKINKKVMGMFEKAESEAAELNKKRAIILDDKAQIEHVIAQLDVEKTRTLETTWKTVSESFGTIFGTLLPGVSAKLVPAEGARDVMDGLDIRVAFGGIEKESLSELSGGQRSLLALSLILALLKFKPAPMYILDEIDAALDLSHTQNIGQVLKKHFSESQFIVVSLKEGMFNNANVLFRTKFIDGVSNVIRTTRQERAKAGIKA